MAKDERCGGQSSLTKKKISKKYEGRLELVPLFAVQK